MDGADESGNEGRSAARDDHVAVQIGDVTVEHDRLAEETVATPLGRLAFDLEIETNNSAQSRAEAIVELIVKSDRVFLDGACWRCTERAPEVGSDLGLCGDCLSELRSVG